MEKVNFTKFCCAAKVLAHGGYSWPQRNYKCNFCKKEFKSAQALGGHMNVHRRDRAKMRFSSPAYNKLQNPKPNNSMNPTASSSSSSHMSRFLSSVTFQFSSPSLASRDEEKLPIIANSLRDEGGFLQLGDELKGVAKRSDFRVWKRKEMVGLNFGISLPQDAKEDVDLELRLGYS